MRTTLLGTAGGDELAGGDPLGRGDSFLGVTVAVLFFVLPLDLVLFKMFADWECFTELATDFLLARQAVCIAKQASIGDIRCSLAKYSIASIDCHVRE